MCRSDFDRRHHHHHQFELFLKCSRIHLLHLKPRELVINISKMTLSTLKWYCLLICLNSIKTESELQLTEAQKIPLIQETHKCNFTGSRCDAVESTTGDDNYDNCKCDSKCRVYGDCCSTSEFYQVNSQKNYYQFSCRVPNFIDWTSDDGIYVRDKCPDSWKNKNIMEKCNKSLIAAPKSLNDLIYIIPVTGLDVDALITYGNVYCAICNGEEEYRYWNLTVSVMDKYKQYNQSELMKNLAFENGTWFTKVNGNSEECSLHITIPEWVDRKCTLNVRDKCDPLFETEEISTNCSSHMSIIYHDVNEIAFKNEYCARCNNITEKLTYCKNPKYLSSADFSPHMPSFSALFDISILDDAFTSDQCDSDDDDRIVKCNSNQFRVNSKIGRVKGSLCLVRNFQTTEIDIVSSTLILHLKGGLNFTKNRYAVKGTKVIVCMKEVNADFSDSPPTNVITTICTVVSIFSLIIHLSLFAVVKKLRNFTATNLACYSLALLSAYACFALGSSARSTNCVVIASFTYYFLLASFFWMLTISFDVWRSFWNATKNLRLSGNEKRSNRFLVYSVFSWTAPALLTVVAISMDYLADDSWNWLKPEFGLTMCWFGNTSSQIALFIVPFSAITVLNAIFFVHTTFMLQSAKADQSVSSTNKYDFRMYLRLSVLMGLTWTTAFVAMYWKYSTLWIVFIVLNAGQGVFILVAFSLKRHVFTDAGALLSGFSTKISSVSTSSKSQVSVHEGRQYVWRRCK